jgi:hypothetical protein
VRRPLVRLGRVGGTGAAGVLDRVSKKVDVNFAREPHTEEDREWTLRGARVLLSAPPAVGWGRAGPLELTSLRVLGWPSDDAGASRRTSAEAVLSDATGTA